MSASLRTLAVLAATFGTLACQPAKTEPKQVQGAEQGSDPGGTEERDETAGDKQREWVPQPRSTKIVRKDLLPDAPLPPIPQLASVELKPAAEGRFAHPEGNDELVPRVALALGEGTLLAGQAYAGRRPGRPPQTWRWSGFVPKSGEPWAERYESGAIRTGVTDQAGGALLTGYRGTGMDTRAWFATVKADGHLAVESLPSSPAATEIFTILPGQAEGELAVIGGYVDAQGWLVSLDGKGELRWEKYIGSYGYTQIRDMGRAADGSLLVIGSRAKKYGELWWAKAPGDGGAGPAGDDVEQAMLEAAGVDQNPLFVDLVDLGEAGFLAIGTAKRAHVQAHDQLVVAGFGPGIAPTWSRIIEGVRVTAVHPGVARDGAALFVVDVPTGEAPDSPKALALLRVEAGAEGSAKAEQIAGSEGWSSPGFVLGRSNELLLFAQDEGAMNWRTLKLDE